MLRDMFVSRSNEFASFGPHIQRKKHCTNSAENDKA
jgi:hypothetical protein